MLIPMITLRGKIDRLFSVPIAFKDVSECERLVSLAVKPEDPSDLFDKAVLAAEFNPETGEVFSCGEDISLEINFLNAEKSAESEVIDEKGSLEETVSEEVPERL